MTKYLLALSIGPVQDFIAAARRTSDLEAGSNLLEDIAKAAAAEVKRLGGVPIVPFDPKKASSNKILAELPEGMKPDEVAKAAKDAAKQVLLTEWEAAWNRMSKDQRERIDDDAGQKQVAAFLEIYAAWCPLGDNYTESRETVERILAGRKALRDFDPYSGIEGQPSSALDPSRQSILKEKPKKDSELSKSPLKLQPGEILDGVSILKRIKGTTFTKSTPSTSLMAFHFLKPVIDEACKNPSEVATAYAAVKQFQNDHRDEVDMGDLFLNRGDSKAKAEDPLAQQIRALQEKISPILKAIGYGQTPPYYVILVADGDRMGKIISAKTSAADHQKFSQALGEFADSVRGTVEFHRGHLIYAGGDDVLALLPVDTAIKCAGDLAGAFSNKIQATFSDGQEKHKPTLSAGIAIVHHLESLQVALNYARAAEKAAKNNGRDSLAVALHTRGGAPVTSVSKWGNNAECLQTWQYWIEQFQEGLSRGLPYELRELAKEFASLDQTHADTIQAELKRIIWRKEGGKKVKEAMYALASIYPPGEPEENLSDEEKKAAEKAALSSNKLTRLANQMVIARFLAHPEGKS